MAAGEQSTTTEESYANADGTPGPKAAVTPPVDVTPEAGQQPVDPAVPEPGPVADQSSGPQPAAPQQVWQWLPTAPAAPPPPASKFKAPTIDWHAHAVDWRRRLHSGFTHLGGWLVQLGKGLGRLASWLGGRLVRLRELRPTPLETIAVLAGLGALSLVGAFTFAGTAIGQACVIAFTPGLCIAIGILGNRWYSRHAPDQQLARATHGAIFATLHLKRSVRYVDERLSAAQRHFENGRHDSGLTEVVRAKTATELALGTTEQPPSQRKSAQAADTETRGLIHGSVARIEDEYTLIVNRGSEHGVQSDMIFAVMAHDGDEIIDPETGAVIGELPTEKLRVKVLDVHPKYSRAVTFRTIAPANADHPALLELSQLAAGHDVPGGRGFGTFESIDESIARMLETELAESFPAREKIANAKSIRPEPTQREVRIDIGDRVRQVS